MRKLLTNTRGSALVYVLFVIVLLALLTPPLLGIASSRSSSDKALGNQLAASQLASSTMESFFSYLNRASGSTKNTWNGYMSAYPGWTQQAGIPITLPDGGIVTLRQDLCVDKDCTSIISDPTSLPFEIDTELEDYYVRVCAVAGDTNQNLAADERFAKKQELVKAVPINRKGAAVIIDPESPGAIPACVAPGSSGVIVGGSSSSGTSEQSGQIGEVIGSFLDRRETKAQTLLSEVSYKSESCEAWKSVSLCSYSDIVTMYNNRKAQGIKPIYIKAKMLTGTVNFNVGSLDNPLILTVEQVTASSLNGTLTGSLYVTGTLGTLGTPTQYALTLNQGKNEQGAIDYGSLYVMGAAQQKGGSEINAQGPIFFGDSSSFTNGSVKITAKSVTVVEQFSVTSGSFDITSTGGPASFGSLDVSKAPTDINAVNGDLFIENDFTGSNVKQVEVGGVVAVGGDLKIPIDTITAGGQGTSLYLPGISGPEYCQQP